MSEENMSKEVMNEEVMSEEVMAEEEVMAAEELETGFDSSVYRNFLIKKAIEFIHLSRAFLCRDHSGDPSSVKEEVDYYLSKLDEREQDLSPYKNDSKTIDCIQKIETTKKALLDCRRQVDEAICADWVKNCEETIRKIEDFLRLNPEEEKKKDKGAYYDKCDNYARTCDGLISTLSSEYMPRIDDASVSAKLHKLIETLERFRNALEANIG